MTQDLKLSTTSYEAQASVTPNPPKKSGGCGCGCFLMGCLGLLLLISVPIIGTGIYIASLDSVKIGEKIIDMATYPEFRHEIREGIQNNSNLSPEEKTMMLEMYEQFLVKYETLPQQQKDQLSKDIFSIAKKLITEDTPKSSTPPAEFMDILKILNLESSFQNLKTNPMQTPPITSSNSQTTSPTTSNDPYNFDLNTQTTTKTTPTQPTHPQNNQTEYDF